MNALHSDLWRKICAFQFDEPGNQLTFAARLAHENGWSEGYARRVVDEYRRFLFLAMVAGHEVTPSEQVDESWHLHLVYTRSYWDELCPHVLGRPLHHHPTRGGVDESKKHHEQYAKTLASYNKHFGEAAPPDIWPPDEIRFGEDLQHVRVNRARNWIVPKPRLRPLPQSASQRLVTTALTPLLLVVANPFDMKGPEFLLLYGILTAMVIVAGIALRNWLRNDESAQDTKPLEPFEVACLGRGAAGVLQSCLAGLIGDGRITIVEQPPSKLGSIALGRSTYKLRAAVAPDSSTSEIERTMLSVANSQNGVGAPEILKAAKPIANETVSKLQSRGLLETDESFGPSRWWPVIMLAGLATFGFIKLCVGLTRGRPVVFLAFWLVGLVVVTFFFLQKPHRTLRGDRAFNELKDKHERLKSIDFSGGNLSAADMMLVTGLFGLAAVTHPHVQRLQSALKPVPSGDGGLAGSSMGCGGGGCGGGGGGGGCGGGCGGCGGG